MGFAHNSGIIHRDIKPENILINDDLQVKLTDFGLAFYDFDNLQTQKYAVVGTPAYMSPEQVFGEKLTNKSDLFSLGVTCLELFGLNNPFLGNSTNDTINKITSFDLNVIEEKICDFPEDLKEVFLGLLNPNPIARFDSCQNVLKILGTSDNNIEIPSNAQKINSYYLYIIFFIVIGGFLYIYYFSDFSRDSNQIFTDSIKVKIEPQDSEIVNDRDERINPNAVNIKENDSIKVSLPSREELLLSSNIELNAEPEIISPAILNVECYPWGKIFLNDKYIDTTPLIENILYKAGNYRLKVSHPDYPEYDSIIHLKSNETMNISINLDTLIGFFNCQVFPWGEIFVDEKSYGITPINNYLKLFPGKHILSIKNPQFEEYKSEIIITKKDTLELQINLNK